MSPAHAFRTPSYVKWLILALSTLLVGILTVIALNLSVYSPKEVVKNYFAALQTGDGARAMELSQAPTPESSTASTALLDGKALASTVEGMHDVTITEVAQKIPGPARDETTVQRTVALSFTDNQGENHEMLFVVDLVQRHWGVFNQWKLHPIPLQTVETTPANMPAGSVLDQPVAEINGVEQPLYGARGNRPGQLLVFSPAQLDLEYSGTYLQAVEPGHLVVTGSHQEPHALEFELELTSQVTQEVKQQVAETLQECTAQGALKPTGCPFGYSTVNRVDASTLQWSIPEVPEVEFTWDQGKPAVEQMTAVARLEVDEISLLDGSRHPTEYEEEFALDAELKLTPEFLELIPQW